MKVTVMIDNQQSLFSIEELSVLAESAVNKTIESEGRTKNIQVSITFVDNAKIRQMNCDYRRIDRPTDVLSFPMLEYGNSFENEDIYDMDLDTGEIVLGDIVISLEKAFEQSKEYCHSYEREVAFLMVHGMLHLLGYDHESDDERKVMRKKEEEILELLNLKR